MDNWRIIMRSSSAAPYNIYLAQSYLESNGVETQLQNELVAQIYSSAFDRANLLVRETDVERGRDLLKEGGYLAE